MVELSGSSYADFIKMESIVVEELEIFIWLEITLGVESVQISLTKVATSQKNTMVCLRYLLKAGKRMTTTLKMLKGSFIEESQREHTGDT